MPKPIAVVADFIQDALLFFGGLIESLAFVVKVRMVEFIGRWKK